MECPVCKEEAEKLHDIRGQKLCMHCQLDRIWDFVEGSRRVLEGRAVIVQRPTRATDSKNEADEPTEPFKYKKPPRF